MRKKLGLQITKIRIEKCISLTKLADKAGISKGYLSSIENHKTNPSAQTIQKIAKALEVPVEQLLCSKAEPLDQEWIELMVQAKELGLDKEEIRDYLSYEMWKRLFKEEV
ncbi:helix-turn-helix domain-containing protein [Fictibacillus barbaricus]|uniref:XRE family transcriptional regulator of biofilm formation n=1 Tax=Fictibacillus barbaricus TaxID=182136 RepID=A0ABU1U1I0_9BACL|nr:helix-turn-helix domain-containing protein [Fictibacillus barbaricus]MDR7073335.1 XRE family transcriptional regulator of biofilm formation [Fictibacillus barbaricus]